MSDDLEDLLSSIKEQNKKSINNIDTNDKKHDKKIRCPAAVQITTKKEAFLRIKNGEIIQKVDDTDLKTKKNGSAKIYMYAECCKTVQDEKSMCHIHKKTNANNLKLYKDIILKGLSIDINDPIFISMGKRGAPNKNKKNNFIFTNSNSQILKILIHKDPRIIEELEMYSLKLLNLFKQNNVTTSTIPNIPTIFIENNKSSKDDESKDDESKDDESKDDEFDEDNESKDDESDEDNESENSDGVSCIEIITNTGKSLGLNQESNVVYEIDGNNDGEEIGILTLISEDYHTIIYNKKLYTVIKKITETKNNKYDIINCCVLTNTIFDKNYNFIGTRTKIKGNIYKFNFNN